MKTCLCPIPGHGHFRSACPAQKTETPRGRSSRLRMDRARFEAAFGRFLQAVADHRRYALAAVPVALASEDFLQAEALQAIEGAVALALTFDPELADAVSHAVLVAMGRHLEQWSGGKGRP